MPRDGRAFGGQWTRRATAIALISEFAPDGVVVRAADGDATARALSGLAFPVFTASRQSAVDSLPLRRPALYVDGDGRAIGSAIAVLCRIADGVAILAGREAETSAVAAAARPALVAVSAIPAHEDPGDGNPAAYVAVGVTACAVLTRLQQFGLVRLGTACK
jgi:hypothetical protein